MTHKSLILRRHTPNQTEIAHEKKNEREGKRKDMLKIGDMQCICVWLTFYSK